MQHHILGNISQEKSLVGRQAIECLDIRWSDQTSFPKIKHHYVIAFVNHFLMALMTNGYWTIIRT